MNVVFDTNVYLDLVDGLDHKAIWHLAWRLRGKEYIKNIRALACPIVIYELLAHLSDPTDPKHNMCVRAIALLAIHCRLAGQESGLALTAPIELEVCKSIFGKTYDSLDNTTLLVGELCELVSEIYISTGSESVASEGFGNNSEKSIAGLVAHCESIFREGFKQRVAMVDPQGNGTKITIAEDGTSPDYVKDIRSDAMLNVLALDFIYGVANAVSLPLTDQQARKYAMRFVSLFRVPLEILREMWLRAATTGFDIDHPKKNRANSLWDMYIAVIAGGVIEDQPVLFVTNENMIIEACHRADCRDNVMRTADYRELIGV